MKTMLKGLIMALVAFVASTISDLEVINWVYVGITSGAFVILYVAKNWLMPSNSDGNSLNWRDALSGVLIAVSMAISSFAGSIITLGYVDWKALGIAVVSAIVGYFTKTFIAKPKEA